MQSQFRCVRCVLCCAVVCRVITMTLGAVCLLVCSPPQSNALPPYYYSEQPPPYANISGTQVWHPPPPPTLPQYAPQPVVTPVVITNIAPPSRKLPSRSRTCCYGCSGAIIVTLALVGIALWLGLQFGTKLLSSPSRESTPDVCPAKRVLCDGYKDCSWGSDETGCVRFGTDNQLLVKTSTEGIFLPVCSEGWSQHLSELTCSQLGFRRSYAYESMRDSSSRTLSAANKSSSYIQGKLTDSSSCLGQQTVALKCSNCGQQQSSSRIIGGGEAQLGHWPWQF